MSLYCFRYDLYKSGDDGHVFPEKTFREFRGERLTWDSFCSQVETRELNKYASTIHVVNAFRDKTMEVMALFEREVMDRKYTAEEADVILTTAHAAKGMEWNNVQVCEDFDDPFEVSCDGPPVPNRGGSSTAKRSSWQFRIKPWGDEVNLLYVACTRAKKLLSISSSIKSFLQDCDTLHDFVRCMKLFKVSDVTKSSEFVGFGRNQPFSVGEVLDLYQDVIVPLRAENKLQTKERLMKALVKPLDGDDNYDDDTTLEGDDEFERFFGYPKAGEKPAAAISGVIKCEATSAESVAKKPKLAKAFYILEEAKKSEAIAPKGTKRPFDKREKSVSGSAKCRECHAKILLDTSRIGVQVYVEKGADWWPHYFHEKCFPKELISQLRLDPNPNRKKKTTAAKKKSWSYGGGHYERGGYSSWGGGWK